MTLYYECYRCNYKTDKKNDLLKHFNRKKLCANIKNDYSKKKLIQIYNEKYNNSYQCEYCSILFNTMLNLDKHKDKCLYKYQCKNCKKIFKHKKNLKNHIQNNICNIEKENKPIIDKEKNVCCNCNKVFSNKYTLKRHLDKYICLNINNNSISIKKKDKDNITINFNTNNYINKITNNNQNNLILNHFGKENLDYLNNEYFINLLENISLKDDSLFRDKTKFNTLNLRTLMEDVHFNDNHKENNNIIPVNFNKGQYKIFFEGDFITKDKKDMFKSILNNIVKIYQEGLNDLVDIFTNDNNENKLNTINRLNENLIYMDKYIKQLDNYENIDLYKNSCYFKYIKDSYNFLYRSLDTMAKDYKEKIII